MQGQIEHQKTKKNWNFKKCYEVSNVFDKSSLT